MPPFIFRFRLWAFLLLSSFRKRNTVGAKKALKVGDNSFIFERQFTRFQRKTFTCSDDPLLSILWVVALLCEHSAVNAWKRSVIQTRLFMTSRWPYWCSKPNLWEFKILFLCKCFPLFEINLHRYWPPDWILSLVFPFTRRQELLDCVTHIRLLAWLLHGSLSHFVHSRNPHVNCHPIKFEENTHIADYVLIILFSFAEQLKVRVLP